MPFRRVIGCKDAGRRAAPGSAAIGRLAGEDNGHDETSRGTGFAAAILVVGAAIVPAMARLGATIEARVAALGLERIPGDDVSLAYSRGTETEASFYAAEVEATVNWYHRTLGRNGQINMAVLDEADYRPRPSHILLPMPRPGSWSSPTRRYASGFRLVGP